MPKRKPNEIDNPGSDTDGSIESKYYDLDFTKQDPFVLETSRSNGSLNDEENIYNSLVFEEDEGEENTVKKIKKVTKGTPKRVVKATRKKKCETMLSSSDVKSLGEKGLLNDNFLDGTKESWVVNSEDITDNFVSKDESITPDNNISKKRRTSTTPKTVKPRNTPTKVTKSPRSKKHEVEDDSGTVEECIQRSIDKWPVFPESRGYVLRNNVRKQLIQAFIVQNKDDVKETGEGVAKKENTEENTDEDEGTSQKKLAEIIVWALEQGLYDNFFIFDPTEYAMRVRTLCRKIPMNPERFLRLDPAFTATMDISEMDQQEEVKLVVEKENQKDVFGGKSEFKCKKCRSGNVTYFELQLRAGDEGATVFYECLACGNKWK